LGRLMPIFEPVEGATPIDDISELIPTHITTKAQLDEWEANNISSAVRKYLIKKKTKVITIEWIKQVHMDMFDETWKWAGKFRTRNINIGVDWHMVQEEVKKLIDDIDFWEENGKGLNLLEQSVRIHHRLVRIHPFLNGNGRHARLIADIFLFSHDHKLPIWPDEKLINSTDLRVTYIRALKDADKGNYSPLEKFTIKLIEA
jgi:Fic-DOC domain mobile mystery protein B